jgi:hypothetical protein
VKIYTRIEIDIMTNQVINEDWFEYHGPVALCGSKGSGGVDKAYNARMATISEAQQAMAEEYMDFWRTEYKPFEEAQLKENQRMLPHMTDAQIAESNYRAESFTAQKGLIGQQTEVARRAYEEALRGVDPTAEANRARADVTHSFAGVQEEMGRDLNRMGYSPDSAGFAHAQAGLNRDRAKATASAMTTARAGASDRNFSRLSTAASGFGLNRGA